MVTRNFLKKVVYWPSFFLCIILIVSVSASIGYQLAGTIYSRYSRVIGLGSIDFSRGPIFDPSVTLPEIVSSRTATHSFRSALPGAIGEVTASWYGSVLTTS